MEMKNGFCVLLINVRKVQGWFLLFSTVRCLRDFISIWKFTVPQSPRFDADAVSNRAPSAQKQTFLEVIVEILSRAHPKNSKG